METARRWAPYPDAYIIIYAFKASIRIAGAAFQLSCRLGSYAADQQEWGEASEEGRGQC